MKTRCIIFFTLLFFPFLHISALEIIHEKGVSSFSGSPKKIVSLDWVLTETLLSLDVMPVGVTDVKGYQRWVASPVLTKDVVDVGSRSEPNIEVLNDLKPDVILLNKQRIHLYETLSRIAPVVVLTAFKDNRSPLDNAKHITRTLGLLLDKSEKAESVIRQTETKLKHNRDKILKGRMTETDIAEGTANAHQPPLLFVRFINDRTLRFHGQGSLAVDVADAMGFNNAWNGDTSEWGYTVNPIEAIAEYQHTHVMIFGPLSEKERQQLTGAPLWQVMAFSREDRVTELPAIWSFGGLISAQRLSDTFVQAMK
ncbi:iron-siderophore ABC transporter substrate-binding protein [Vibrio sp.]|nr:iron-siderophore ABC transporter substrate-binding protein [Vibrio sp.]